MDEEVEVEELAGVVVTVTIDEPLVVEEPPDRYPLDERLVVEQPPNRYPLDEEPAEGTLTTKGLPSP